MIISQKDGVTLRHVTEEDLSHVEEITVICYTPIAESFINIVGEDFYRETREPNLNWQLRKVQQVLTLYQEHPDQVWVLEKEGEIFGFVTFEVIAEKKIGIIDNNGLLPKYRGQGWGAFMYRHVLQDFRQRGLRFAIVETDLDNPHIPARRAYESCGFDSAQGIVVYRQDLQKNNPGSMP